MVIVFFSCNDLDKNRFDGDFIKAGEKDYSILNLIRPNRYEITEVKNKGWIELKDISKGTYKVVGSTIYLKENWTWKKFSATRLNEYSIVITSMPNFIKGDTIFCIAKYYPNGIRRMALSWRNSKKDGLWQYWDEKGNFVCDTCFKDGLPSQDTIYCKPDTNFILPD